jgi:hypothetical protein
MLTVLCLYTEVLEEHVASTFRAEVSGVRTLVGCIGLDRGHFTVPVFY